MSRNTDVLQDRSGCDFVLDKIARTTFAECIHAVTISHPEMLTVCRDRQIIWLRCASWRHASKNTKGVRTVIRRYHCLRLSFRSGNHHRSDHHSPARQHCNNPEGVHLALLCET